MILEVLEEEAPLPEEGAEKATTIATGRPRKSSATSRGTLDSETTVFLATFSGITTEAAKGFGAVRSEC